MMDSARVPEPASTAAASAAPPEPALSDRDLAVLAFERRWWKHAGAKEQAIRAEFGLSAARYYQLLGALIDSPRALAHDPMLVKRLQRMREARSQAREYRSLRPSTTAGAPRAEPGAQPSSRTDSGQHRIEPV